MTTTPLERLTALVNSAEYAHVQAEARALLESYPPSLQSPIGSGLNGLATCGANLKNFVASITPVAAVEPAEESTAVS